MGIHNQAMEQAALSLSTPKPSFSVDALAQFNHLMPPEIWRWRDGLISKHSSIAKALIRSYISTARQSGYYAANAQLRLIDQRLNMPRVSMLGNQLITGVLVGKADISSEDISELADACAGSCKRIYEVNASEGFDLSSDMLQAHVEALGVTFPYIPIKNNDTEKQRTKLAGAIARVCDSRWWRMRLRRKCTRQVEQVLRELGAVKRNAEVYVSDWAYRRWQQQNKRNRAVLERLEVVNELDESCSLAEAVDASVSNPVNRRAELMLRMRGYEEIADSMDFKALFLTLTAPSKYHERLGSGAKNSRSVNATPAGVMTYLNGVWARIRAKWNRNGIRAYGFRVAEPHHDGTPHWHMLLFFNESQCDLAWSIFKEEALAEDGNEAGAQKHRATCVYMDKSKGSATGYIAKYIAKNVDGKDVGLDEEAGKPANDTASRTRAWASLWGIRQFQQIGAVSVTVWRELRRRTKPLEEWECTEAEALRAAADTGDWVQFVALMGGATVKRDEQTLRPQYQSDELMMSRYGEEMLRLLGVVMRGVGRLIKTRLHTWRIREKAPTEQSEVFEVEAKPPPLDLCQ